MNVRRFEAASVSEALAAVKKEFGDEAVILRTRSVRKDGWLPFRTRQMIEVTAASPDRAPVPGLMESAPRDEAIDKARQLLTQRSAANGAMELKEDISELKEHIRMLAEQIRLERAPSLPPTLDRALLNLSRSGLERSIAGGIASHLCQLYPGETLEKSEFVERELRDAVAGMIKLRRPPLKSPGRARIVAIVGPTGVGKTTTLAKLVTSYRFWGKCDTALVSADTYRVAALEQLKTFASIAGLPMETAYQPGAMKSAIGRHKHRDAIFIDTAGRSTADPDRIEELATFLEAGGVDEVLLCLAVSTRLEDQLAIIGRYALLKPTGIIFTKLAETRAPGAIVNVGAQTELPVTFITCGQNVPDDDILMADPRRIAEVVLHPESMEQLLKSRFSPWIGNPGADA
ncbi:MAG: flagellar biosynthesis protein FlhF [Calditrichaeota bacterium]|nr:flagellar biosynthesis protein FlhF [Calditrichota bacterium]